MGVLGDATPGITAFVNNLPGIEKFTDDERVQLIAGISNVVSVLGTVINTDLKPVVDESAQWRGIISTFISSGVEGSIGGIPFVLKASKPVVT